MCIMQSGEWVGCSSSAVSAVPATAVPACLSSRRQTLTAKRAHVRVNNSSCLSISHASNMAPEFVQTSLDRTLRTLLHAASQKRGISAVPAAAIQEMRLELSAAEHLLDWTGTGMIPSTGSLNIVFGVPAHADFSDAEHVEGDDPTPVLLVLGSGCNKTDVDDGIDVGDNDG